MDLSKVESVAICGIGNVALDCARLLLRPPSELAGTDIADRALRQLRERSAVKEVHLIARRGPVQVGASPSASFLPYGIIAGMRFFVSCCLRLLCRFVALSRALRILCSDKL